MVRVVNDKGYLYPGASLSFAHLSESQCSVCACWRVRLQDVQHSKRLCYGWGFPSKEVSVTVQLQSAAFSISFQETERLAHTYSLTSNNDVKIIFSRHVNKHITVSTNSHTNFQTKTYVAVWVDQVGSKYFTFQVRLR